MKANKKIIGERIKMLRQNSDFTQEELARKLKLNNKSSISQYENGTIIPSDDVKFEMVELFDCSFDYLLGNSNTCNAEKELEETSNNSEIFTYYNQLNDLGKEKAIDNVKDLTKIPEYTEKRDKSQNA